MNLIAEKNLIEEIDSQISKIDLMARLNAEDIQRMINVLGGDLGVDIMSDVNSTFYYMSLLFMKKQLTGSGAEE